MRKFCNKLTSNRSRRDRVAKAWVIDNLEGDQDIGNAYEVSSLLCNFEFFPHVANLTFAVEPSFKPPTGELPRTDKKKFALAIAGGVLPTIYGSPDLSEKIGFLFSNCESVIVYRSSPKQKAETVKYIRKTLGSRIGSSLVTMAIGDGANDVNMIQSAHIGVGIRGKEGSQAASFADYALPKFRDLRQLLFWHGRSFSVRATNFSCWFSYKAMLFSIPLVLFNAYAAFSGLTYMDDYYYALYEVILTTWAICAYLFIEVDVDSSYKSASRPGTFLAEYYSHCREVVIQPIYKKLFLWSLYAWYSGCVLFFASFMTYGMLGSQAVNASGKTDGIWTAGFASFTILILAHHVIIFLGTRNYTVLLVLAYIFSLLCFMPLTVFLNVATAGAGMYRTTFSDVMSQPIYWMIVAVGVVAICMPYFFVKQFREYFKYPELYGHGEQELVYGGLVCSFKPREGKQVE